MRTHCTMGDDGKMSNDLKADLAKMKAYHEEKARKMAKFGRLPREDREIAFQAVKARQGGYAVVKLDDMIDAYEKLTGKVL